MRMINIHDAKTHLSKLIEEASEGNEVIIAKAGKPVARLVPVRAIHQRKLGLLAGSFSVAADFDAALPEETLILFDGGKDAPAR
ncbi:MAG: type II toxin-antitoxin system Phd/YefM family antitoxin [Candidatus Binataceae bacterium]